MPMQMATLDKAEDLLEQLRGASVDAAKRDLADIQAFAAEQGFTEELQQASKQATAGPGLALTSDGQLC